MGVVIYPFFAILENQHISIDQVPYILKKNLRIPVPVGTCSVFPSVNLG